MMTRMSRYPVRRACVLLTSVFVALAAAVGVAPAANAYTVYPGDSIHIRYSNGDRFSCTLNSVAYRGDAAYGVTAGHCLEPISDAVPVAIYAADDRTVIGGDLRDSGREYWGDHTLAGALRDIAWFRLEGHVINGGVMRGGHVEIPFIGAINGLSALVQAISPDRSVAGRQGVNSVQPGHSGSPVYTLNPDRSANIIGIASGTAFGVLLAVDQLGPLPAGLR